MKTWWPKNAPRVALLATAKEAKIVARDVAGVVAAAAVVVVMKLRKRLVRLPRRGPPAATTIPI